MVAGARSRRTRADRVCFAPEVDAVAGGIIIAVGVDALRHVSSPKQLALASLPVLLGLHQLTEAFVWWGLQGHVSSSVERAAVWVWLLFAFVALPALLPIAVELVERSRTRRRVMRAFAGLGIFVAGSLAVAIFRGPINARIVGHCIAYQVDAVSHGGALTALYVVAACGALLASSHRLLAVLGALNLVVVPALMWLTIDGFVSLWCFWAAIASLVVAAYLRREARMRDAGPDDRLRLEAYAHPA